MTDTLISEEAILDIDNGDHDKFSHIVAGKNRVTGAYIEGTPVMALCGKVWVPDANPERFQVCGTCKDVYKRMTGKEFSS